MNFNITTYNIKFSSFIFEEEIVKVAECLDSHILCLQEFPLKKLPEWKNRLATLGYQDVLVQKTCETLLGIKQSNVIFSKFPLEDKHSVDLTYKEHEARKAQYCLVDIGDEQVFLLHTHLGLRRKERIFQMHKIIDILNLHGKEEKMILVGDFNDWNNAGELTLGGHFKEAHHLLHGKCAKSFPARVPMFKLDRIYFRNLAALSCEVLRGDYIRKKSDHLPVRASFEF